MANKGVKRAAQAADPGMPVKMGAASLPGLDRVLAGEPIDEQPLWELIAFVNARIDCADFRLVTLLTLLAKRPAGLTDEVMAAMKQAVLDFRYWMDEPGNDSMCFWSENHQALFAACEYLAGQLYPREIFTNLGVAGLQRRARGEERLRRWLGHRFRYGFTEWLSPTYYEEDVAALTLIIEHAADAELVERARIVLDLLLLDMALHRFRGRFVGTAGRCYEQQKKNPASADVSDILAHAFDGADVADADLGRLSSGFVLGSNYAVPQAIRDIAAFDGTAVVKQSVGLELDEVDGQFVDRLDIETTGAFYWLMEAFTNPESIDVTVKAFKRWSLQGNTFLAPLAPFATLTRLPGVKSSPLARALVRLLNPATQGVAIQRANIYAFRSPAFHLSSAQGYHPREFGDQQHIWQATLPRDITVFATHPGVPMFDANARNFSPSYWVGNGRNPDVGQHENILIALYDTGGRGGYLERERQRFSHLYFPFALFDETRLGATWVAGRADDAYIGVRSLAPLEMVDTSELVQRGAVTGYGVVLGSVEEYRNLADFIAMLKQCRLTHHRRRLLFRTPQGRFEVRGGKGLWRNGTRVPTDFNRFETPWVRTMRNPDVISVRANGAELTLNWATGERTERTERTA